MRPGALFYTKTGSLYVSEPAGTPGRKLTDGPADAQPAPSPDLSHVVFVRKATAADYGGELWILDLSPQLAPVGPPRRLVDPAALAHGSGDVPAMVASPRWSPTGKQVAFVDNPTGGAVDGGYLLVAAADTGALAPTQQKLFAESGFAWAPDGRHIAWVQARSDVRPVDVNVLAVGGASTPVATDTNASSVTYSKDGQAILFANGDASGWTRACPHSPSALAASTPSPPPKPAGSGPHPLHYSPSRVRTTATSRPWVPALWRSRRNLPGGAPPIHRRQSRSSTRVRRCRARRSPTSRLC
ncbi:WD40-like Beta Propeller Repeat family protein [Mycobacterium kansasii]|uniref:WD40-like Beta Propeller Repeat family protein n=1 Tax=Mycobacterium kansasii TaxID=1768 RepID=A0A1V3XP56_MYCKA|nr:WD40-like Beta Propeller Repeat family protein [Mycobacterium kansasii]